MIKPPINLPVTKEKDESTGVWCVKDSIGDFVCEEVREDEADYIVDALNEYRDLYIFSRKLMGILPLSLVLSITKNIKTSVEQYDGKYRDLES